MSDQTKQKIQAARDLLREIELAVMLDSAKDGTGIPADLVMDERNRIRTENVVRLYCAIAGGAK